MSEEFKINEKKNHLNDNYSPNDSNQHSINNNFPSHQAAFNNTNPTPTSSPDSNTHLINEFPKTGEIPTQIQNKNNIYHDYIYRENKNKEQPFQQMNPQQTLNMPPYPQSFQHQYYQPQQNINYPNVNYPNPPVHYSFIPQPQTENQSKLAQTQIPTPLQLPNYPGEYNQSQNTNIGFPGYQIPAANVPISPQYYYPPPSMQNINFPNQPPFNPINYNVPQPQEIQPQVQIPFQYYNANPAYPSYSPYPNVSQNIIPLQDNLITPSDTHEYINPYLKLIYNGCMCAASGVISKLITINMSVLESKFSLDHTEFPDAFKKICKHFDSAKSLCAIFPFCLALVINEYSKLSISYVFGFNDKKMHEQLHKGEKDIIYYKNAISKSFLSSFLLGFILSKPLNLFDSIVLGISNQLDVKGKKFDEHSVRQSIKNNYYENFYRKLHNYSTVLYTLHFGLYFGIYDSTKHLSKYFHSNTFLVNFKLALLTSVFTNCLLYPLELVRKRFSYNLIYNNNKIFDTTDKLPKEPFFKEFKDMCKSSLKIIKENSFKVLGYGLYNKILPSTFTAFTVALYENYRL